MDGGGLRSWLRGTLGPMRWSPEWDKFSILRLLVGARVHHTFHVSLLKRCPDPTIAPVHPPKDISGSVKVQVSAAILDRRMVQRRGKAVTEILVSWQNKGVEEASWEEWHAFQLKFPEFAKEQHP